MSVESPRSDAKAMPLIRAVHACNKLEHVLRVSLHDVDGAVCVVAVALERGVALLQIHVSLDAARAWLGSTIWFGRDIADAAHDSVTARQCFGGEPMYRTVGTVPETVQMVAGAVAYVRNRYRDWETA